MKFVIQRVTEASVEVDEQIIGEIANGYLVLIGVGQEDTTAEADRLIKKMTQDRSAAIAAAIVIAVFRIKSCASTISTPSTAPRPAMISGCGCFASRM